MTIVYLVLKSCGEVFGNTVFLNISLTLLFSHLHYTVFYSAVLNQAFAMSIYTLWMHNTNAFLKGAKSLCRRKIVEVEKDIVRQKFFLSLPTFIRDVVIKVNGQKVMGSNYCARCTNCAL